MKSVALFTTSYWNQATKEIKDSKKISLCALLIALQIVISAFYLPVGENLRIYAGFFLTALSSCILGPVMALVSGFILDNLSFIIHPSGAYFFGYTLSSMLGALLYALFLYRTKITILKLFLSKLCVNLFVNALLGSCWTTLLYTKGFWFYFSASLIKNLTLLPFEVLLLVIVFKSLAPFLASRKLILTKEIPWF